MMDGGKIKTILISVLSVAVGIVSIYGTNPLVVGYYIASYAEGANGIILFVFSMMGLFFSDARVMIIDYGIIFLVSGIIMFILKKKKHRISTMDTIMIGAGVNLGVQISSIINNDYIWARTIFVIIEILITLCAIIVLKRGIAYIMMDKSEKKLEKEELISLSTLLTIIFLAGLIIIGKSITIMTIGIVYFVSIFVIRMVKYVNLKSDNSFDSVMYACAANNKLKDYSQALMTLSKGIQNTITVKEAITKDDVNKIFDGISEKYCGNCDYCTECWEKEFYSTYKAANMIVENGIDKGFVCSTDLPEDFTIRCTCCEALLADTNKDLEIARYNMNWMNKMNEARGAFALQIRELSKIIEDFSNSMYISNEIKGIDKRKIKYLFRQIGVKINDLCEFQRGDGRLEIIINAKLVGREVVTMKEAAKLMSDIMNKSLRVVDNGRDRILENYNTITFVEEYTYKIITGVARYKKDSKERCGDNYAIINNESEDVVLMISDGMGTGERACEESERIVNIVEQFVESGFDKERSIKLLNSFLILKEDDNVMSTIDIAVINENTGMCEFYKSGAAATFIKRRKWVEYITSDTLPIGIFYKTDCDKIKKQLYDGDFVILMSDGVIDGITDEFDKEKYLEKIINNINTNNPQVMAEKILQCAIDNNENIADDMTVMVAGLWIR